MPAPDRPNLLFVICHDLGRRLSCYGRWAPATPHLDRLAAEGVRFGNCFCTAPQCSPSRGSVFTGRYPHANGLMGLVNAGWDLPDRERHLAALLRDAGYRTALVGNQHEHREPERLGYQQVVRVPGARGRDVAPRAAEWLRQDADRTQPFFLCVGMFEPHRPYDAPGYEPDDPASVSVLPYLPDTAEVRGEIARLNGLIKALDQAVGIVIEALDRRGSAGETLVVFTTDHGLAMPRAKCTLYDPGIETALLMRRPAEPRPGAVCDHLVSNVDLLPTLLDLMGLALPGGLHGRSFASAIDMPSGAPRSAVFAEKTFHGPCHPMRCVRTARHKYIRNWRTDLPIEIPLDVQWGFQPDLLRRSFGRPLPAEELYDLAEDPHEQRNLAAEPHCVALIETLRRTLDEELRRTGDPLLHGPVPGPQRPKRVTEAEYWAWAREGGTPLTREEWAAR